MSSYLTLCICFTQNNNKYIDSNRLRKFLNDDCFQTNLYYHRGALKYSCIDIKLTLVFTDIMKLGLDDSVQESSDKVTNFGDCSGDIDGEEVRIVPRTIKHAKRRGVLPASQTNDHMQWKEMPIKKKKR